MGEGLLLTQVNAAGEPIIREPEMLHAFSRTLDGSSWQMPYGIEVPTKTQFRFIDETGENTTAARHDLVLLEKTERKFNRDVLIELKREQPKLVVTPDGIDCPAISKDFRKLLLEKAVTGKCMFHICHAADNGTIKAVLEKYNAGFAKAIARATKDAVALGVTLDHNEANWFALYILVVRVRHEANQPFLRVWSTFDVKHLESFHAATG